MNAFCRFFFFFVNKFHSNFKVKRLEPRSKRTATRKEKTSVDAIRLTSKQKAKKKKLEQQLHKNHKTASFELQNGRPTALLDS